MLPPMPPPSNRPPPPSSRGPRSPYQRFHKLERPKLEPAATTLWEYPSQHYGRGEQGSKDYRGATPSWVIWQVLQRFSREGDTVLDPFCGSGTTLDVCRDLRRKGLGFDIAPARDDIQRADARSLPVEDGTVDCAFLDPPYADNLTYSDDPDCIGRLKGDDGTWHDAMARVLAEMARVVRPGGTLAVYVSDVRKKTGAFFSLGVDLAAMGQSHFTLRDHVIVARGNKDLEKGNYRKAAVEQGFYLRGFNHLLLFQRPKESTTGRGKRSSSPSKASPAPRNKSRSNKGGRPGGKPGGRAGDSEGGRPSAKKGERPSGKKGGRPSAKKGGRPSGKKGGRPSGKKGGRPSGKKGGRPSGKKGPKRS
jgi:DNA modification methylase